MKRRIAFAVCAAAVAVVFSAASASAQNDMCVPSIGGLAGTPQIDGIVDGYVPAPGEPALNYDAGWNRATRWNLSGDHGATTATKLQAGFAGGFLYLSYVVDTPTYGQDNTIVIGFAATGAPPSTDWRIHITPANVANPPDGAGKVPVTVVYWRDGDPASVTYWNNNQPGTNDLAHWTYLNTRWSKSGTRWALEIKIPVTNNINNAAGTGAVYLPAAGVFRFYTAVLNTFGFIDAPTVVQDPWPAGVDIAGGDLLQNRTPAPDPNWGQVSFNARPACDGVGLTWANIGVLAPPAVPGGAIVNEMQRFAGAIPEASLAACNALADNANPGSNGPDNQFVARPVNTMIAPANGVFATFRLANWGIPAPQEFDKIGSPSFLGVTDNPTPDASVPAAPGIPPDLIAHWALTYKQSCQYKFKPHQCIQVDLDSHDPSVRFINKSVQRNMDFVPLSTFQRSAVVSGDWAKVLGHTAERYRLLILVETDRQFTRGSKPPAGLLGPCQSPDFRHEELVATAPRVDKAAQFAWIARGILVRDDVIIINKTKYRKGTRVGDFGYVGTHKGPFYGLRTNVRGAGLEPSRLPGVYVINVPHGKPAQVETRIEAIDRPPIIKKQPER